VPATAGKPCATAKTRTRRPCSTSDPLAAEACIAHAEILHGKEMSYNNFLDGDAALEAVRELVGRPGLAIIKHNNPCGYATGAPWPRPLRRRGRATRCPPSAA
jgi:phosphoribosylaminoimidazolecarboxamide formyltransferase/IMP cyclohydrolase